MKRFLILIIVFLQIGYAFSQQEDYYTILEVNGKKSDRIAVGKDKVFMGNGDIVLESDEKIHWTDSKQSITVYYTGDGETYTFNASDYYYKENKEKYSRLNYMRTTYSSTKGQENKIMQELYVYLIHDIVLIDEFRLPIDDQHMYYLVYLDEENKIKKIEANQYEKSFAFYFTREQLEGNGVLHNKKIKQLRYNNAGVEITVVSDLSLILVK